MRDHVAQLCETVNTRSFFSLVFLFHLLVLVGVFFAATAEATEYSSDSYVIKDPVLAPSGYATSAGYALTMTVGQIAIGTSTPTIAGTVGETRSGFEYFPFVNRPTPSATAGAAQVSLSWTASTGFLGWTVSGYSVGQSTVSGGPYSFSAVGNVTSVAATGLANGTTYYFVIAAKDFFGNFIATSTEVSGTPVAAAVPTPTPSPGGGGIVSPSFYGTTTLPSIPITIPPLSTPPSDSCRTVADLNCDGYVDIVDFSIMYYWYEKDQVPARVDLAADGVIDLADFSVMAFYWHERNYL
jgi:hypothetical protein